MTMQVLHSLFCILLCTSVFGSSVRIPFTKDLQNEEPYGLIHVSRDDVTFRLWTRDQQDTFRPLYFGHLDSEDSIRREKGVKIIIHGWTDSADNGWVDKLMTEYLIKDDYNIIGVDWSKPASALYPLSAKYTKDVGTYLGELIEDLNETLKIPFENIHLIGHSLGAHISGFAGKYIIKNKKSNIGRITGLDPAGPLFFLAGAKDRLCPDDADFVDVIHTDGKKLGLLKQLGKIDFYPNGGHAPQPGCLMYNEIIDAASCSHTRSYLLFVETINSEKFISKECESLEEYKEGKCDSNKEEVMGENVNKSSMGTFYLTTNSETPYAKH